MAVISPAKPLDTPVVLLIFNRPELTSQVMEQIARAQPRRLLVIADGPRNEAESEKCEQTRKRVLDRIDWPCELLTDFSKGNLGCGRRVSSGINWVFSKVDEAIFLEDDCVPNQSFFTFCQSMLERYRDDQRVMHVAGSNLQFGRQRGDASYYFSRYNIIWGWAAWKRSWAFYDFEMRGWPHFRDRGLLEQVCDTEFEARNWKHRFESVFTKQNDTWDYQWCFACWSQAGLTVTPNQNLITNLGFGADATHTKGDNALAYLDAVEMGPLVHPSFVIRDRDADRFVIDYVLGGSRERGALTRLRYLSWRLRLKLRQKRLTGANAGMIPVKR